MTHRFSKILDSLAALQQRDEQLLTNIQDKRARVRNLRAQRNSILQEREQLTADLNAAAARIQDLESALQNGYITDEQYASFEAAYRNVEGIHNRLLQEINGIDQDLLHANANLHDANANDPLDFLRGIINELNNDHIDNSLVNTIKRLYDIREFVTTIEQLRELVNAKQQSMTSICNNEVDPITQQSIISIPYPLIIPLKVEGNVVDCFNILDLRIYRDAQGGSWSNPLRNNNLRHFSQYNINIIEKRLRDLGTIINSPAGTTRLLNLFDMFPNTRRR